METPALIHAVWEGSAAAVAKIAQADPAAVSDISTGQSALHVAAQGNKFKIGKVLLDHGADPNLGNYNGHTPLHNAASNGAASFCRLLIQRGAVLDVYGNRDVSPLGEALCSWADGAAECAKLLRKARAAEDLITAIFSGDDALIAKLLVEKSHDERHQRQLARCIPDLLLSWKYEAQRAWMLDTSQEHEDVLSQVVAKHLPTLDLLLARGAQIDMPGNTFSETALFLVLRDMLTQGILVRPLLERGADPNQRDRSGESPFAVARQSPNAFVRAIAALLEYGARE